MADPGPPLAALDLAVRPPWPLVLALDLALAPCEDGLPAVEP